MTDQELKNIKIVNFTEEKDQEEFKQPEKVNLGSRFGFEENLDIIPSKTKFNFGDDTDEIPLNKPEQPKQANQIQTFFPVQKRKGNRWITDLADEDEERKKLNEVILKLASYNEEDDDEDPFTQSKMIKQESKNDDATEIREGKSDEEDEEEVI